MATRIPNTKLFIDNEVVDAVSNRKFPTINPVDGNVIAQTSEGDKISQDLGAQSLSRRQQVNKKLSEEDKILKNGQLFNATRKNKTSEEKSRKIKKCLNEGADVNAKDANDGNNTPLHIAVLKGEPEIAKLLLDRGAIIDNKNADGKNPLDIAKLLNTPNGQDIVNILEAHLNRLLNPSGQEVSVKEPSSVHDPVKESKSQNQLDVEKNPEQYSNTKVHLNEQQRKKKRSGKQGLHGEIYQLKLLMLFLKRGIDNRYSFRLGAEKKEAKKFDDLFFEITKDGKKEYRLLQAKHKEDESQKIKFDNLLTESDSDYSLVKYFFSYQDSKKEKLFKNGIIKDVTVCTNINLDLGDKYESEGVSKTIKEVTQRIEDSDSILDVDNKILAKEAVRYRFSDDFALFLKPRLESYNLTRLARRLAECFLKNVLIKHHEPHDIFRLYHTVLAKEIIDVKAKKFRDKFIKNENISEDAKKFRKVFAEEIKKQSKEMLTLEDINSAISGKRKIVDDKPVSLNLSKKFGEGEHKIWPNNAILDEDIKDFLDHLVFAVNQPNEEQLGIIIESYISKDFNFAVKDYVYNELFVKMLGWLNGKGEEFISCQDGRSFFEEIKQKLSGLELTGLTLEYRSRIEKFGIEFSQEAIHEIRMNFQVFNVITQQSTLSAIKVYQVLQNRFQENYIFMQLDSILRVQDRVIQAFEGSSNLLVIECKPTEKEENIERLYYQLLGILQSSSNKKVVLITQGNDFLANRFKSALKDKYKEKIDEKNSLTDLTNESQNKLLSEGKVIFQGEEVSLGTLIDDKSKHLVDAEVLSKLINDEKIKIGKTLTNSRYKDVKDYYIDRTFNRHIKIKEGFMEEKSKFFITRNAQVTENLQQNQDIVLISDREEDFKKLCEKYKEPIVSIHWLKQERNKFIWQQSHSVLSKFREFVDTYEQSIQEYKPKKITDIPDRVVIIAAEPGMGKSTVLTRLALKTKESDPSLWVVRINLLDQTSRLYKWQKDKTEIDESQAVKFLYGAMDFLVFRENGEQTEGKKEKMINNILELIEDNGEIALKNNEERKIKGLNLLEVGLFYNFYEQGKIALLFDGFDEISPVYKDQVIKLLEVLKGTKAEKIWMTTRPYNIQSELENKLGTFSYALKPFLEEEQRNFLKKFWKKNLELSELDEQRSEVFIDELLPRFSEYINDQERGFVGIPLQISMIAKVFQDTFKEFYDSKSQELSNEHKQKLSEKLNLVTLYKCFIEIKFYEIRFGEKKPAINTDDPDMQKIIKNEYEKFIEDHRKLALFEDNKLGELLSEQERSEVPSLIESIEQGGEKTGIINVINGKPNFIHRTFAEYFAASYLWEKFKSIQFDKFRKDFIESIIINNLIKDDRIQICKFFQLETQKDLENNIDFSDKEDKLKTLLTTLVDKIYSYGIKFTEKNSKQSITYIRSTVEDEYRDENSKRSAKLLLKIIEFSLSAKEGSDLGIIRDVVPGIQDGSGFFEEFGIEFSQDANDRKLALLCVSAEMGYIKLADALIRVALELSTQFLQDYLKDDNWLHSPVWIAAKNGHLDVLQILVKKLSYDITWKDKDGKNLFQRIFQRGCQFDVLRSYLKLDKIDVIRTYGDYFEPIGAIPQSSSGNPPLLDYFEPIGAIPQSRSGGLPLLDCIILNAPLDVIELLIEKTDIDFVNQFKIGKIPAVSYIMTYSSNYDKKFVKILAEKGIDLNAGYDNGTTPINIITFDFKYDRSGVHVPRDFLKDLHLFNRLSYVCQVYKSSPKFFNSVKSLLEYGAIYNLKYEGNDALQHVKQTHYIQKLLKAVFQTADKENDPVLISNLLDKISDKVLQLTIKSHSTKYRDCNIEEDLMSKINESNGISLLNKVLLKLNNVGQKNKIEVLKSMLKFSDQSSQTFELLKTIDDLFDAINTNNKESVVGILQDAESKSFIEAAVNVRNKQRQTLLDLACEHYNVEIINLLRGYGAKFGNDYL